MAIQNCICRGLVGYISYLATCSTSQVYSEYLLYEPIHRISLSKGFSVNCEFSVTAKKSGRGDNKRIDFDLRKENTRIGLEVKWIKRPQNWHFENDINKLSNYKTLLESTNDDIRGYVILFGKFDGNSKSKADSPYKKAVKKLMTYKPIGAGSCVKWESGFTSYACRWFRFA